MSSSVLLQSLSTGTLLDQAGNALNGHQVYVYLRGTTTQVSAFSDAALTVPLSQPLVTGAGTAAPGGVPGYVASGLSLDFYDATGQSRQPAEALVVSDVVSSPGTQSRVSTLSLPALRDVVSINDTFVGAGGAVPDMLEVADGAMSSTSNPTVLGTAHTFTATDAGKLVCVQGAGASGDDLRTTIASVASGVATLASPCLTTVSGAVVRFGTDAYYAMHYVAQIPSLTDSTTGGTFASVVMTARPGKYMLSQTLAITQSNVTVDAPGAIFDVSCVPAGGATPLTSTKRYGITAVGNLSQTPTTLLATDAQAGQMHVQVNTTTGLAAGDWVQLCCDGPRAKLVGGQNGLGGNPTIGTAMTATDTAFLITNGYPGQTVAPFTSTNCFVRIGSELILASSIGTPADAAAAAAGYLQVNVRTSPSGRGLWAAAGYGSAGAHTVGTSAGGYTDGSTVYEQNTTKVHCKGSQATADMGEWHRIAYIDQTGVGGHPTVYFDEAIDGTYLASNLACLRDASGCLRNVHLSRVSVQGMSVGAGTPGTDLVHFEHVIGFSYDRTTVTNASYVLLAAVSCVHGRIVGNDVDNAEFAYNDTSNQYYGIGLWGGCQNITVTGNVGRRCSNLLGTTALNSGGGHWGIPRHITVTANAHNCSYGLTWLQHANFQIEGPGRHIVFADNIAKGGALGFYLQGSHIVCTGNKITDWTQAAIKTPDDMWQQHDVTLANNAIGVRAKGGGLTTLTAGVAPTDLTATVASTRYFFSGNSAKVFSGLGAFATITGGQTVIQEIFSYKTNADGVTLNIQTRGLNGTTAGTFATGTIVVNYGVTYNPLPLYLAQQSCLWGADAYQTVTTLAAPMATGDTTATLTSAAGLPTVGLLQIEAQLMTGLANASYATEVISYNGITGNVLQNVVRGALGTTVPGLAGTALSGSANSHDTGALVGTYTPGVANIAVAGNTIDQDFDYPAIHLYGYTASQNVSVTGNKIRNVTPLVTFSNYAIQCEPPNLRVDGNMIDGFSNGIRVYGAETVVSSNTVKHPIQQTSGYAIRLTGACATATGNEVRRLAFGVKLDTYATGANVTGNVLNVGVLANAITGALADSVCRNNTIPGATITVAAAGSLTLPCPGNLAWTVTGTTAITNIAIQADQTEITLRFTGTGTVTGGTAGTSGAPLLAGGTYAASSNGGALTLVSDGTNWREKARVTL